MVRVWKCRKCGFENERKFTLCQTHRPVWTGTTTEYERCPGRRPKRKEPAHREIMAVPYERWVERFGEVCGICGRKPTTNRRLDRDHAHHEPYGARGLLCHSCNRTLSSQHGITVDWLLNAAKYLDRDPIRRL